MSGSSSVSLVGAKFHVEPCSDGEAFAVFIRGGRRELPSMGVLEKLIQKIKGLEIFRGYPVKVKYTTFENTPIFTITVFLNSPEGAQEEEKKERRQIVSIDTLRFMREGVASYLSEQEGMLQMQRGEIRKTIALVRTLIAAIPDK